MTGRRIICPGNIPPSNQVTQALQDYDDIDYTRIRFPSDQLNIGTMRHLHPDLFDVDNADFDKALRVIPEASDGPSIGSMLRIERLLARNAFEEACGAF